MKRTILSLFAGAIALTAFFSCQNIEKEAPAPTGFKMNEPKVTINVGDTKELSYTVTPAGARLSALCWISRDETVATASAGFVKGLKEGKTWIVIADALEKEAWTFSDSVEVTVSGVVESKIELNRTSVEMFKGKLKWEGIKAYVSPFNATNKSIAWTSSDPTSIKFVKLDKDKKKIESEIDDITCSTGDEVYFIAYTPGNYVLTATSANGKKATCNVTVLNIDDIDMWTDNSAGSCDIIAGDEGDLKGTFLSYSKATGKVSWTKNETGAMRSDELEFKNGSRIKVTQVAVTDFAGNWKFHTKVFAPNTHLGISAGVQEIKLIIDMQEGTTASDGEKNITNNLSIKGLISTYIAEGYAEIDYEAKTYRFGIFFNGNKAQAVETGKDGYGYIALLPELGNGWGGYNFVPVPFNTTNYGWLWFVPDDLDTMHYGPNNWYKMGGKDVLGLSFCACKSATPSASDYSAVNGTAGYDVIHQCNPTTDPGFKLTRD